ncbi:MAG: hypothetical protein WD048_06550 [Chitinophagales bacterium]
MKNFLSSILLIALLILSNTLFSQSPEGMNYQAVVRNASGEILQNATADLRFTVIEDLPTGITVYQESFSKTTNDYGLVNVVIGEGTALSGLFSTIDWSNHEYYLQVEVNTGNGFQDMGTTKFMSVPYAMHAKYSDTAKVVLGSNSPWTLFGNDIYNTNAGNVGIGTAAPFHKFEVNGQSSLGSSSNVVTGGSSVAVGLDDTVSGYGSFAAGRFCNATANHSISMGFQNNATGGQSFSINRGNTASGNQSFAAGRDNVASGTQSFVAGIGNSAVSNNEVVIGQYATEYSPQGNNTDRIFAVGVGANSNSRQDAITILKSGNVGLSISNPQEKLDVNGAVKIQQNTTNPQPRTVYGNSTPIAYGFADYLGNLGSNSYGVASMTRTATGRYTLVLDNPASGAIVFNATMWDTNVYGFINYYPTNSTTITIRTRNGSGTDTNQGFSFVVYGTPQ